MNLLPLWTAIVCPTESGEIVDDRAQVLTTFFSLREFISSTFRRSLSSMYGPFFTLRAMSLQLAYLVALPRRRLRTMSLFDRFFACRVFTPSGFPHGETGGRPPDDLPSPPPS